VVVEGEQDWFVVEIMLDKPMLNAKNRELLRDKLNCKSDIGDTKDTKQLKIDAAMI
jgi:hypothetical protein